MALRQICERAGGERGVSRNHPKYRPYACATQATAHGDLRPLPHAGLGTLLRSEQNGNRALAVEGSAPGRWRSAR